MENSEILLGRSKNILQEAGIEATEWAVGGGTVLCHYFHHRLSKDIDIFLKDIQLVGAVSPRLNDEASDALDYDEDTRYVSLTYPEGKTDFIWAGQITDYTPHQEIFFSHLVYLEDPVEIVMKKLVYRGDLFLPRDIFDLAMVLHSYRGEDLRQEIWKHREQAAKFLIPYHDKRDQIRSQLYSVDSRDMLLPGGIAIAAHEIEICDELLQWIQNK